MFSQTLSNKDRINNYQEFHQLFLTAINESFNLDDLRKRTGINILRFEIKKIDFFISK